MKRRDLLTSTGLAGVGLMLLTGRASAFSLDSCAATPGNTDCREIARHNALIAEINDTLAHSGMSDAAKRAYLASVTCPFCGQPLYG